jgi:hypothetical protein
MIIFFIAQIYVGVSSRSPGQGSLGGVQASEGRLMSQEIDLLVPLDD